MRLSSRRRPSSAQPAHARDMVEKGYTATRTLALCQKPPPPPPFPLKRTPYYRAHPCQCASKRHASQQEIKYCKCLCLPPVSSGSAPPPRKINPAHKLFKHDNDQKTRRKPPSIQSREPVQSSTRQDTEARQTSRDAKRS